MKEKNGVRSTFTPFFASPIEFPRLAGSEPSLITRARVRRARSRTGVHACVRFARAACASLFQRAQHEQRERSAPLVTEWGLQTSGRAAPRRWKFNSSVLLSKIFPPRARATPLFLDTRDTVVRRAVHVPRTYTYSREGRLQKFASPFPARSLVSRYPFTKFVLLLFSFRGRRSGRSADDRPRVSDFLPTTSRFKNLNDFLLPYVILYLQSLCRCKINFSSKDNKRYILYK